MPLYPDPYKNVMSLSLNDVVCVERVQAAHPQGQDQVVRRVPPIHQRLPYKGTDLVIIASPQF